MQVREWKLVQLDSSLIVFHSCPALFHYHHYLLIVSNSFLSGISIALFFYLSLHIVFSLCR
jgi:hypothetical protein